MLVCVLYSYIEIDAYFGDVNIFSLSLVFSNCPDFLTAVSYSLYWTDSGISTCLGHRFVLVENSLVPVDLCSN